MDVVPEPAVAPSRERNNGIRLWSNLGQPPLPQPRPSHQHWLLLLILILTAATTYGLGIIGVRAAKAYTRAGDAACAGAGAAQTEQAVVAHVDQRAVVGFRGAADAGSPMRSAMTLEASTMDAVAAAGRGRALNAGPRTSHRTPRRLGSIHRHCSLNRT
jgi:hypothetical protein